MASSSPAAARAFARSAAARAMGLIPPTAMMVYGPRDEAELEVVWDLLRASHAFATGTS